jgi:hypothetical protein
MKPNNIIAQVEVSGTAANPALEPPSAKQTVQAEDADIS